MVLSLITAGCAGGDTGSSAPGGGEDAGPLRITSTVWVGYGPLYLARDKGFFEEEGVEVELITQTDFKQQFAALAAGRVDGIANVVDAAISYHIPNVDYQMVLALDDSQGGDGIGATTDIQSISDLAGKKVGYETGATAEFFFNVMLEREGMTDEDVEHVEMLGSDAGAALLAGRIDAAVTYEPFLSEVRNGDNTHVLLDTRETPGLITDVLMFSKEVIESRPDDIQAVVDAYYKALEYYEENPEESIEIMAAGVGGFLKDPKAFEETLQYVTFLDEQDNQEYFSDPAAEGTQIEETTSNAVDIWGRIKDLEGLPPATDFITDEFVK
ncbi:MAG: ABC transporter substrate-binding protein [Actinomycetota bacterium]|nr:ABC transporter substrate-binding protein [Actinomycetota bacterium]